MNLTSSTSSDDTHACCEAHKGLVGSIRSQMSYCNSQNLFHTYKKTNDTQQNCSTQQYLCLRLLMQATMVKLNVEVVVILDESNLNHLWNWMNA